MRFAVATLGRVRWSVSLSLPLGISVILLLSVISSFWDGAPVAASAGNQWWQSGLLPLGSFWTIALTIQVILTQALYSLPAPQWLCRGGLPAATNRQGSVPAPQTAGVTLTLGGVWIAIPEVQPSSATLDPDVFLDGWPDEGWLSDENHGRRPRVIDAFIGASRVLFLWSLVLMSLGVATMICLAIDRAGSEGFFGTKAGANGSPIIAAMDRPWIAAGWIFCLQGFWQLLPLPQSLGRIGWSAAIGLFTDPGSPHSPNPYSPASLRSDRDKAAIVTRVVRWWVAGFAVGTLVLGLAAISISGISTQAGGQTWPALAGVALLFLWLFTSIRSEDLFVSQFILVGNGETGIMRSRIGIGSTWKRWRESQQGRRRVRELRKTAQRERAEAADADRVDEILERLHAGGPAALNREERAILTRVSEAIRRERARTGRSA